MYEEHGKVIHHHFLFYIKCLSEELILINLVKIYNEKIIADADAVLLCAIVDITGKCMYFFNGWLWCLFLMYMYQSGINLKSHLEEKADGLAKLAYQLQAHVVVLAENGNFDGRYVSYACIHSTVFFETTSLVEAVDISLKSSFVLGLQFPAAAYSSWSFVQNAVYELSSCFDRIPFKVYELITDFK